MRADNLNSEPTKIYEVSLYDPELDDEINLYVGAKTGQEAEEKAIKHALETGLATTIDNEETNWEEFSKITTLPSRVAVECDTGNYWVEPDQLDGIRYLLAGDIIEVDFFDDAYLVGPRELEEFMYGNVTLPPEEYFVVEVSSSKENEAPIYYFVDARDGEQAAEIALEHVSGMPWQNMPSYDTAIASSDPISIYDIPDIVFPRFDAEGYAEISQVGGGYDWAREQLPHSMADTIKQEYTDMLSRLEYVNSDEYAENSLFKDNFEPINKTTLEANIRTLSEKYGFELPESMKPQYEKAIRMQEAETSAGEDR